MKTILPPTELKSNNHEDIDKMDNSSRFDLMINSNNEAIKSVEQAKDSIEEVINQILKRLNNSNIGRIIYCGAGTSARIGVQDGSELYPTFGWPHNRLDFIIAGGDIALLRAVEKSEDNINEAISKVKGININHSDVVIGLAASGNTPFTCQVLKESRSRGALTIGIFNNKNGLLNKISNFSIILNTGSEVVTGSTRLKAGTAQKVCLNIISTLLMIKMGRVKNGYMSHMLVTNEKLRQRQIRINKELMDT